MRPIDGDALLEKFNRKADIMTALTDEDTANDFAFYCKLADAVEEMPTICGWISVKDRLPEEEDLYAVYCKDGSMALAWFNDNWFIDGCECGDWYVTHWIPLPEPPKEDDHATDRRGRADKAIEEARRRDEFCL